MTNSDIHYRYISPTFPVLLFILIFNISLHAQVTRYVAITGDDIQGANSCSNPNTPCRTIAHAINVASAGDAIDISAGVYTETLSINKSLSLVGAGQGITILQAHPNAGVATDRVITINGDLNINISDISIRHGRTTGVVTPGGGIYNMGSKLTMTNVTIHDNEAAGSGGGMLNFPGSLDSLINVSFIGNIANNNGGGLATTENSEVVLIDVVFDNNSAVSGGGMSTSINSISTLIDVSFLKNHASSHGGGMRNSAVHPPILNNVIFDGNTADGNGGGMNNGSSDPHLVNVTFINNIATGNGGAVYNNNSNPVLQNVIISGNSAELGGGMVNNNSAPILANVLFSGNKAEMLGGGMRNSGEGSNPVLTNVTFSGNSAAEGGGMANSSAGPVVVNGIFWNNVGFGGVGTPSASIFNDGPPGAIISYSLVQGINYSGVNNLDGTDPAMDPLFVEPPDPTEAPTIAGDLRLQEGSPVIDKGDPDTDLELFLKNDDELPVDLDGNPRVFGRRIDLGAYEYIDPTSVYRIDEIPTTVELYQNYPNPFNPATTIRYSIPAQTHVQLTVYDLLGRMVEVLIDEQQTAGSYELHFNAGGLSSGVYLYRLKTDRYISTKQFVLLK